MIRGATSPIKRWVTYKMLYTVPPAIWVRGLPVFTTCSGSKMDVGAPIATTLDPATLYIESIAEIINADDSIVGWVYLTSNPSRQLTRVSVYPKPTMSAVERKSLGIVEEGLYPLPQSWDKSVLRLRKCTSVVRPASK